MAQGSRGKTYIFEDMFGGFADGAWAATGVGQVGQMLFTSVNEGALAPTLDEPGGILAVTTDVGDDDNWAGFAGGFKPADGGMWMETRLKIVDSVAATRAAVWVGFAETLSLTTPVMPFETATATTTYNGTGGMAGFGFDSDATDIDFRFAAGDAGAALATAAGQVGGAVGAALGIRTNGTMTADRWMIFRVEVRPDGLARGWYGGIDTGNELRFIGRSTAALGTGDTFHAVVMIENRAAANEILEIDYVEIEGNRDWLAT